MVQEPARRRVPGAVYVQPAPVKGWNARDDWERIDEEHAVLLDNWVPTRGGLKPRPGSVEYADLSTLPLGSINGLYEFRSSTGRQLLASGVDGANLLLVDVTDPGSPSTISTTVNLSNSRTIMVNQLLVFANGISAPHSYDGTSLAALAITGPSDLTDLVAPLLFKSRVYYIEKGTLTFWYGGTSAVAGAFVAFDLTFVAPLGGSLAGLYSMTRDGGAGPDDFFVALTTEGDVIVYAGSDPGDATNWSLVGRYRIPKPNPQAGFLTGSIAPAVTIGSHVYVDTQSGYVDLPLAIEPGRSQSEWVLSDIINEAVAEVRTRHSSVIKTMAYHPRRNWLLANHPVLNSEHGSEQHVFNFNTGTWTRFLIAGLTSAGARYWLDYDGDLYFAPGLSTKIFKLDDAAADDNGNEILCDAITAPSYGGKRTARKQWDRAKPLISSPERLDIRMSGGLDFEAPLRPALVSYTGPAQVGFSLWDYDPTAWAGRPKAHRYDHLLEGLGYSAMTRLTLKGSNLHNVTWHALAYHYSIAETAE